MTPFARYFNLNDPDRDDFRLSTSVPDHLRLYVDLDETLPKIDNALAAQTPLLVLEGDFGTGKSHLLRYVERVMLVGDDRRFEPVYVVLSGFHRRSDFVSVHQQIAPCILPKAMDAMQAPGPHREKRVQALEGISENMRQALWALGLPSVSARHDGATIAMQWLMASSKLTSVKLTNAGFTSTLFEEAGPSQIVNLYKAISDLYQSAFQRRLLLLFDEGESFSNVVDIDAQANIGSGIRTLFDSENRNIGCFLGLNTPRARGHGVHPMLRSDVQSRIGSRHIRLSALLSADRAASFMGQIWPMLTKDAESPPFLLDRAGIELVANRLDGFRSRLTMDDEQLSPSPSPRDLLHVLSDIGQNAVRKNISPPIRADLIQRWYAITKS